MFVDNYIKRCYNGSKGNTELWRRSMKADIIVKGIIYNKSINKVLLLRRCSEDEIGAGTWENAGGNVEQNEHPEEAMKREIHEETGIAQIRIEKVAYVTLVNFDDPYLIIAYLCESLTDEVKLSDEHQAYVWADEQECRKLLPKHIIGDFEKNGIFELLRVTTHQ